LSPHRPRPTISKLQPSSCGIHKGKMVLAGEPTDMLAAQSVGRPGRSGQCPTVHHRCTYLLSMESILPKTDASQSYLAAIATLTSLELMQPSSSAASVCADANQSQLNPDKIAIQDQVLFSGTARTIINKISKKWNSQQEINCRRHLSRWLIKSIHSITKNIQNRKNKSKF